MKILVCTDGSEHSQKALEKVSSIASELNVEEVAIIHVYDNKSDLSSLTSEYITAEILEGIKKAMEVHEKEREEILEEAQKFFNEKNIKARKIFKEGHPSHTIINVANEEGFDLIVVGSRGFGGLKKIFLGSVSNAVVQEARNCSVLIVK
ncbi:MAG: universal stress protein [Bacillota bacterium]|nr:universal stress protein [Bacillota bacterium]